MVDPKKLKNIRNQITAMQVLVDSAMEKVAELSDSGSNQGMVLEMLKHANEMREMVDSLTKKHDKMLQMHIKKSGSDYEDKEDYDESYKKDYMDDEESKRKPSILDFLDSIDNPEQRELVRLMMMSEKEMYECMDSYDMDSMMDRMDSMSMKDIMAMMESVGKYYDEEQKYYDEEMKKHNMLQNFMLKRSAMRDYMMSKKRHNTEQPISMTFNEYEYSSSYKKGDRVSWAFGNGRGSGTVISTHTSKITKNIDGATITRNGSKENPAVYINSDDGNNVLKLSSELSRLGKASAQDIETGNVRVGQRVSWAGSTNRGLGTVKSVHKKSITTTIQGNKVTIQGTEENPAVVIKTDTGTEVVKRESDLSLLQDSNPKNNKTLKTSAGKYSHIDFKPTDAMVKAAKRGLELRSKYGRGGTAVGIARARDIANGKTLSPSTVKRMHSFFSRHEQNKDSKEDNGEPGNGKIAWLLWGGNPGQSWARARVNQIDAADKKD